MRIYAMDQFARLAPLLLMVSAAANSQSPDNTALKNTAIASIEAQRAAMVEMSDAIWGHAETALGETQSAEVLAAYAESQGFVVERGVAGMPTAFIATYGEGEPIIAIMGEYDALPRLSGMHCTRMRRGMVAVTTFSASAAWPQPSQLSS
jgi:aminobenzoyl-glutamate utilization protein B